MKNKKINMQDKLKALFAKKISFPMLGFLAFFTVIFIFWFLCLFGLDMPEKYIPIITASVALYTPFGAYKLGMKWKEQAHMEAKHDAAKKLLLILTEFKISAEEYYNICTVGLTSAGSYDKVRSNTLETSFKEMKKAFLIQYDFYRKVYDDDNLLPDFTYDISNKFNLLNFYHIANTIVKGKYLLNPPISATLLVSLKDRRQKLIEDIDSLSEEILKGIHFKF